jgi:mono/diheme cytochrome c family protein
MNTRWVLGAALGVLLAGGSLLAAAAPPGPAADPQVAAEGARFFETRIRPLFLEQCGSCHGDKVAQAKLRLDTREGFLKGGASGPLIAGSDPAKSLLVKAVRHDGPVKMPPQGKLRPQQIEDLTTWVRLGAPWPAERRTGESRKTNGERPWAFTPVKPPTIPAVKTKGWVKNPIDAFVLAKLEAKGLTPSPLAGPRELIRRAYFDLIGLPPSPEEVDAFVREASPNARGLAPDADSAYEKLVDRLLAMPQYGERWGRHWLDVVRYAQTNGYERDDEKPHAWRYRDYVIKSLNEDKPYDRFIREQVAGDELDHVTDDTLTATAFYRLGVWDDEPDDPKQAEFDNLDDVLATMSQSFMGLTVGCARCHDHKFDPIAQDEYYGLLAFMRNVKRYVKADDKAANETIFRPLKAGGMTLAVYETGPTPEKTHVLIRGNAATPGAEVTPKFLSALAGSGEAAVPKLSEPMTDRKSTGRRRVLGEWITSSAHPLTARVMVNRLWHHHFGRGIVATPNDFGKTGVPPTHPELLDYLASVFSSPTHPASHPPTPAWSLKRMHRLIMLSATYRQSSRSTDPRALTLDPGNTLLWRQNMRRLEAEAIRDAILSTSGKLNLEMGGRGIFPELPPEVLSTQSRPGSGWGKSDEKERSRRSVYIFIKRTLGVPFLESFDAATPDSTVAQRATTTIAPQALILLNSGFMDEQSAAFADRLLKEAGTDSARSIERAFRLAVGRAPTERERTIAAQYIEQQKQLCAGMTPYQAYRTALARFCKVVLNLNEFVYID